MYNLKINFSLPFLLLCFLQFNILQLQGQKLHTPDEIQALMQASLIQYESLLNTDNKYETTPSVLEQLSLAKDANASQLTTYTSPQTKSYLKFLKRGNRSFGKKKYNKARKYYLKALAIDEGNAPLMKQIGDVFGQENNWKEANNWYQKSISTNVAYTIGHQALADSYLQLGNTGEAVRQITIAHLRNRNDKKTLAVLKRIYQKWGKLYNDSWSFTPKSSIEQKGEEQIRITAASLPWLYYTNCKAYWYKEAGYRKAMANDFGGNLDMVEEKECLLNWLIGYENLETEYQKEQHPSVSYFLKTMDDKYEKEFILYEIWLVNQPKLIYDIEPQVIERLIDYIWTYRTNTGTN